MCSLQMLVISVWELNGHNSGWYIMEWWGRGQTESVCTWAVNETSQNFTMYTKIITDGSPWGNLPMKLPISYLWSWSVKALVTAFNKEKALVKFREVPLAALIVHIRRRQTYFRISEYTALTAAAAAVFRRQVVWIVKHNAEQLLSSAIFIFIHCHCNGLQGRWTACVFSNRSDFSIESWFTYISTRLKKQRNSIEGGSVTFD